MAKPRTIFAERNSPEPTSTRSNAPGDYQTEVELAPVAKQLHIFAELHSPEPTLTRSIVGDCQMEDRVRTCGKATEYFCRAQ